MQGRVIGNPKVTVLMSVYNCEKFLSESIESILNQVFADFEFIIIDDGSRDRTWEILKAYEAQDNRIVLLKNTLNIGLTKSLNKGLSQAKGRYVARQDADDISLPERIKRQVEYLDTYSDVVLVSCNIDYMGSGGKSIGKSRRHSEPLLIKWFLMFYNHIGGHSQVMFRIQPVLRLAGYSEERYYSQDYELWLRLSQKGKFVILPDVLLRYRYHENKISYSSKDDQKLYSLMDSKMQLQRLTEKNYSIAEVEDLRNFWLDKFSLIQNPYQINPKLTNIYHAFIKHGLKLTPENPKLKKLLRKIISRQFYLWARTLSVTRQKEVKTHVLACGYKWYPQGLAPYLTEEILTDPVYALFNTAKNQLKAMLKYLVIKK